MESDQQSKPIIKPRQRGPGRPFVKGDPRIRRCLTGRPRKEICIPDILRRIGSQPLPEAIRAKLPPELANLPNQREALLATIYLRAIQGEAWAAQFVADRTEGRPRDHLTIEGGQRLEVVEEIVQATGPGPVLTEGTTDANAH